MREIEFKKQLRFFYNRWFLNSVAIWLVVELFGQVNGTYSMGTFLLAGFIFSVVNSVLKPIITIISLPAILLTLGLFTLVVNGVIVWISLKLAPNLTMTFGNSILAGIILSSINYAFSSLVNEKSEGKNL